MNAFKFWPHQLIGLFLMALTVPVVLFLKKYENKESTCRNVTLNSAVLLKKQKSATVRIFSEIFSEMKILAYWLLMDLTKLNLTFITTQHKIDKNSQGIFRAIAVWSVDWLFHILNLYFFFQFSRSLRVFFPFYLLPFSSGFFPAIPRIPGIAFFLLVAPRLPTMTSVLKIFLFLFFSPVGQ